MNNDVWVLDLNGDTFNAMKTDFNKILQRTLNNMEQEENETAEIKISIKIRLTKNAILSIDSQDADSYRDVIAPRFIHKIVSEFKTREEENGSLGTGNEELVWDPNLMKWVMRPIDNGQGNLFDEDKNDGPIQLNRGGIEDAEFHEGDERNVG